MALRKAYDVAADVVDSARGAPLITADRLALVQRLRDIVDEYASGDWVRFVLGYCEQLEQEIKNAD